MGLAHAANNALSCQLPQPVDRVDDVQIALEPDAVKVNRDMIVTMSPAGMEAGRKRHSARPKGKGLSPRRIKAGAGYDRHLTPRQRRTDNERLVSKTGHGAATRHLSSAAVCPQVGPWSLLLSCFLLQSRYIADRCTKRRLGPLGVGSGYV